MNYNKWHVSKVRKLMKQSKLRSSKTLFTIGSNTLSSSKIIQITLGQNEIKHCLIVENGLKH